MSDEYVRSDSLICIQDATGQLKTVIYEGDYERIYKPRGWTVITQDWTKEREIRKPVNMQAELELEKLAKGVR